MQTRATNEHGASRENLVHELFARVVDVGQSEREAFLADASAKDSALAREGVIDEVSELLRDYQSAEEKGFLQQPLISDDESHALAEGQDFEGYKIVNLIAEGGMGEVYLAHDPTLGRKVAIKLVKGNLKTRILLRRFRNERQILANLQHANIAKLFQAGATGDGLPFFVMEYVDGKPIAQYVDEKNLSITELLKLFRTVCSAVSYAHQNLVIHRDIKPSNILVTVDGEPRLLDFGIAKMLHEADSEQQDETVTVQRMMTPEYASPEQVKGEPITTATDVYSLGVLLYELLTGRHPYKLKRRTADEMMKAICEQEPSKPSDTPRDTETGEAGTRRNRRQASPPSPRHPFAPSQLRGDLDNIVLKALRKEPARRYISVEQFSEDIRRHLEGLPVIARKDTVSYRASKFIKRNKIAVTAAAVILLTLMSGIIATTVEARLANRRFNEVRQLAHSVLFDYHDEIAALPGSTKVRERLVRDALEYLDNLSKDARNDVSLLRELAGAYEKVAAVQGGVAMSNRGTLLSTSNLGDMPGALESLKKALATRERVFAMETESNETREELSYCYVTIGFVYVLNGPPGKAVEYLRKGMPMMEAQLAADPENEELQYKLWNIYLGMAKSLGSPAVPNLGDTSGAMEYMTKAQEVGERLVSNYPTNREYMRMQGASYNAFGQMFTGAGKQQDALQSYQKAAAIDQALVNADASNMFYKREQAVQLGNVGSSKLELNDSKGAVESFKQALVIYDLMVAVDPNDAAIRRNAGVGYRNLAAAIGPDNRSEALKNFNKALEIFAGLVAKDASNSDFRRQWAFTYLALSRFQSQANDLAGAIDSALEGIKIDEVLVAASPTNASARNTLALLYTQLGASHAALAEKGRQTDWRKARDAYQKSLDIYQDMKTKGTLSGANAGKLDELAKEIAKCDAVLAKLR